MQFLTYSMSWAVFAVRPDFFSPHTYSSNTTALMNNADYHNIASSASLYLSFLEYDAGLTTFL